MKRYRRNKNKGFTLAELLITVAITIILAAVGFIAIFQYQQNLKFTEMENDAREVFLAAQNSLTSMKENGVELKENDNEIEEEPSDFSEALKNAGISEDADQYWNENRKHFRYVSHKAGTSVSKGSLLNQILDFGSVDETVRTDGSYIIEYDEDTYTVYGVFYTDYAKDTVSFESYYPGKLNPIRGDSHKDDRKKFGSDQGKSRVFCVGYYGAAADKDTSAKNVEAPDITIYNSGKISYVWQEDEKEAATLKNEKVSDDDQNFKKKDQRYLKGDASEITRKFGDTLSLAVTDPNKSSVSRNLSRIVVTIAGKTSGESQDFTCFINRASGSNARSKWWKYNDDTYVLTLDDISDKNGHFTQNFRKFIPGEDLTVSARFVTRNGKSTVRKTLATNSLFDKTDQNGKTAYVRSPRQLQNLEPKVSNINKDYDTDKGKAGIQSYPKISKVNVEEDINWNDFGSDKTIYQWNNAAVGKEGEKDFLSVYNAEITEFDGNNKVISNLNAVDNEADIDKDTTHNDAGLFAYISERQNLEFRNVILKDINVNVTKNSGNAGGLIGESAGTVNISNCRIYADKDTKIKALGSRNDNTIGNAGGLIGYADHSSLEIEKTWIEPSDNQSRQKIGISVTGPNNAGGIIGVTVYRSASISDTHFDGGIKGIVRADDRSAGGFIGRSDNTGLDVKDTYSTTYVYTNGNKLGRAGGFIGFITQSEHTSSIKNSYYAGRTDNGVYGNVVSNDHTQINRKKYNIINNGKKTDDGTTTAGGFIGTAQDGNAKSIVIDNCYSTGSVYVNTGVAGGFIGKSSKDKSAENAPLLLSNTYSTGAVAAGSAEESKVGAFVGQYPVNKDSSNNYYLYGINGDLKAAGDENTTVAGIGSAGVNDDNGPFKTAEQNQVTANAYDAGLGNRYPYRFIKALDGNSVLYQHVGDWPVLKEGIPQLDADDGTLFYLTENAWVSAKVPGYSSCQFYFTFDGSDPLTSSTRQSQWNGFNVGGTIPTGYTLPDGTKLDKDQFEVRIVGLIRNYDSSGTEHITYTPEAVYKYYVIKPVYDVGVLYQNPSQSNAKTAIVGTKLSDLTFSINRGNDSCHFNENDGIVFFTKDGDKETVIDKNTVVEAGKDYYVRVHLTANDGYGFRTPGEIIRKNDGTQQKVDPSQVSVGIEDENVKEENVLRYGVHNTELSFEAKIHTSSVLMNNITPSTWDLKLNKNDVYKATYTYSPANASYPYVTWSSDNPDIAVVNQAGYVTGVNPGVTRIRLVAQDGSNTSSSFQVTVSDNGQVKVPDPDHINLAFRLNNHLQSNNGREAGKAYNQNSSLYYAVGNNSTDDIKADGVTYLKNNIYTVDISKIASEYTFANGDDMSIPLKQGKVVFSDGKFYLNLKDRSGITLKGFLDDESGYVLLNDENVKINSEDGISGISVKDTNQLETVIDASNVTNGENICIVVKDIQTDKLVTGKLSNYQPWSASIDDQNNTGKWLNGMSVSNGNISLKLDDPSSNDKKFKDRFSGFTPGDNIAVYVANAKSDISDVVKSLASNDKVTDDSHKTLNDYDENSQSLVTVHKIVTNSLYGTGTGTGENKNTAVISSVRDLRNLNASVSGMKDNSLLGNSYKAIQTGDIDLNGIQNLKAINNTYLSGYDGMNHKISNMDMNTNSGDCRGLFGEITNTFQLKNIIAENFSFNNWNSSDYMPIGGLIGSITSKGNVSMENCQISGIKVSANPKDPTGGIVGNNDGVLNIRNVTVQSLLDESGNIQKQVALNSNSDCGGLIGSVGKNGTVSVTGSTVIGNNNLDDDNQRNYIKGSQYAGGLIGNSNAKSLTITDSGASVFVENNGNQSGGRAAGGLIGHIGGDGVNTITASYVGGHTKDQKYDGSDNSGKNILSSNGGIAGGFTGVDDSSQGAVIKYSYTTASVYGGNNAIVGGFIGSDTDKTDISYCYATGLVTNSGDNQVSGTFTGTGNGKYTDDYVLDGINTDIPTGEKVSGENPANISSVSAGTAPFAATSATVAYPFENSLFNAGSTDRTGTYPYMSAIQLISLAPEEEQKNIDTKDFVISNIHYGDWPVVLATVSAKQNVMISSGTVNPGTQQSNTQSSIPITTPASSPQIAEKPKPTPSINSSSALQEQSTASPSADPSATD